MYALARGSLSNELSALARSRQTPLAIGQTFELPSAVLAETRRINIYRAAAWDTAPFAPLPVLYMPDGGVGEDFLHVEGLLQVSVGNG